MKILITLSILLLGLQGQAATQKYFFECSGFAGIEEYRTGISLDHGKAGFFDNDVTTYLELTTIKNIETLPPQVVYVFEGKDLNAPGDLKLEFNKTKKHADLFSIESGKTSLMGSAPCLEAEAWDDL